MNFSTHNHCLDILFGFETIQRRKPIFT